MSPIIVNAQCSLSYLHCSWCGSIPMVFTANIVHLSQCMFWFYSSFWLLQSTFKSMSKSCWSLVSTEFYMFATKSEVKIKGACPKRPLPVAGVSSKKFCNMTLFGTHHVTRMHRFWTLWDILSAVLFWSLLSVAAHIDINWPNEH